eukprot:scaffold11639_cov172-Amphora_coffeaeformis.AAC.8
MSAVGTQAAALSSTAPEIAECSSLRKNQNSEDTTLEVQQSYTNNIKEKCSLVCLVSPNDDYIHKCYLVCLGRSKEDDRIQDDSGTMKGASPLFPSPQRNGRFSRRTMIFLVAIPILWILYENLWQESSSLNLREDPLQVHSSVENVDQPPIGVNDLADIAPIRHMYANHSLDGASWDEAIVGREPVLKVLKRAGLTVDLEVLKLLPTWDTVKQLYGEEPVILGMERCAAFRKAHRPVKRYAGIAGQHNCG